MKHLLLISLLFLSGLTKAQGTYLPDEIWYDTGKGMYIQYCLQDIFGISYYKDISDFQIIFTESIKKQIQEYDRAKKISITIDNSQKEKKVIIANTYQGQEVLPLDMRKDSLLEFNNLKLITKEGAIFNCYFTNMDEMMLFLKNEWGSSIQSISSKFQEFSRRDRRASIILHYRKNGEQFVNFSREFIVVKSRLQNDAGVSDGGVGINFFKSKFLPSFYFKSEFIIYRKGIQVNKVFANLEVVYDFVSENQQLKSKTNGFLDIGLMSNHTKNPAKSNWYGFSIGYLLWKKSDIFDDHTWRFSVHRNLSENIELVPQMYFTDNFSKVFTGLKVNVSF